MSDMGSGKAVYETISNMKDLGSPIGGKMDYEKIKPTPTIPKRLRKARKDKKKVAAKSRRRNR